MTTGGLATVAKTPRRGYFKTWALKEGVLPTDHANGPFHELDLEELWKGVSLLFPIACRLVAITVPCC